MALALNAVATLTEGISLFLLLPLIGMLQDGEGSDFQPLRGILPDFNPGLGPLLIGFVLLVTMQTLFARAKSLYTSRLSLLMGDKIRTRYFAAIGQSRWELIQRKPVSDFNHMLTVQTDRVRLAFGSLLAVVQTLILLAVYAIIAATISWQMALAALAIGSVLFLALFPVRRHAALHGHELSTMSRHRESIQLEFLNGMRVAKSFVSEGSHVIRFCDHLNDARQRAIRYIQITSLGNVSYQIGSALGAAAFIWVAISVFDLDLARLLVLILIFIRIAPRFSAVQDSIQTYATNVAAFVSLQQSYAELARAAEPVAATDVEPPLLTQAIRFEHISRVYSGSKVPALDDVSLSIRAGRITALIGPSGSGKSTLADLALGLTLPSRGQITIDGEPLVAANCRAWRSRVAYVPQEAFLLNDTIEANLRIANPDASDEDLRDALGKAKAMTFVEALPAGLQTVVGERGARFSGGERQRLSLARALLKKPDFLILDEATSALDWDVQQQISSDIAAMSGQLTILTIAHRPSMIAFADDVIAFEHGKVVEQGEFAELASDPASRLARMMRGEYKGTTA